MGGFPDAYTIYTADREQCWNRITTSPDERVMHPRSQRLLSRGRRLSQPLAHTLKFRLPDTRGSSL